MTIYNWIIILSTFLLGGGGVIGIIKFLNPNRGLEKKIKLEIKGNQGEKCVEAYSRIMNLEHRANHIEYADIVHGDEFQCDQNDLGNDHIIYMSIMENRENLSTFIDELDSVRRSCDKYITDEVSAYLLYASNYIVDFLLYLKNIEYDDNALYPFGIILAPDIQKWQRSLDSIVVKEINKVDFDVKSHTGKEWESTKAVLDGKYKKTILYEIINND